MTAHGSPPPLTEAEREQLIEAYAIGPQRLATALATVPAAARQWRPAATAWSVHEVIVHCADSETHAACRIRYLAADRDPLLLGYDQDGWARALDYHSHPLAPALAVIEAVRANTSLLLRQLPPTVWQRAGRHSESGAYTAATWLRTYGLHLEQHAQQIEANLAAWLNR